MFRYARGEGAGAITLGPTGSMAGVDLASARVRSDGKSASLTAPNGSAQVRLLRSALGMASVGSPRLVEAHGTGTPLGDPTEMGALERALGEGAGPSVSGAKSSFGHGEPTAGMVGLHCMLRTLQQCSASPNAQLRALNALLVPPMCSLMALAATQSFILRSASSGGVSSFGYSGTIAHAVARCGDSRPAAPRRTRWHCSRCQFTWREPVHPFAQQRVASADGGTLVRSAAAGPLLALVSDHVVQSRVVFPGAGYLELARVAAAGSEAAALRGVFFVQPFAVEGSGVWLECALSGGRFEVRSVEADEAEELTVHCSGGLASWSEASARVDHACVRGRLSGVAVEVAALYDGFYAVGLQYGPGYRTLRQAWAGGGGTASARLRARSSQQGTQVHPSDLDDALCVTALSSGVGGGETRLPFAVEEAALSGAPGELWAVASRPVAEAASVRLGAASRLAQAQLDGFKSRAVQATPPQSNHLYEMSWDNQTGAASVTPPSVLFIGCACRPGPRQHAHHHHMWEGAPGEVTTGQPHRADELQALVAIEQVP